MKICLVTAFPPSRRGLNEYGYHLVRELQSNPLLSVTVLADTLDGAVEELPGYDVHRCWSFDDPRSPLKILKAIRELKPDIVWFNLVFSSFGNNPVAAFLGLLTPAMTRLSGTYSHVTLHHLMETMDMSHANIRFPWLYRAGGFLATRLLLMANSISVLLPGYRRTLMGNYKVQNVHLRPHGTFSEPQYPDFEKRGNPDHRIVTIGKWGTYKRLEALIEAFGQVAERHPTARLIIAGGDHPMTPGYVDSVRERFRGCDRIEITGYLAEEKVPDLFRDASIAVLPYSSAGGPSGVAHLACEFGVPVVCSDIPLFRDMARDEDLAISFFEPDNPQSLAKAMGDLLDSPELQRQMAEQNLSAGFRQTMPRIVQQYLRSFDVFLQVKGRQFGKTRPAWRFSR